MDISRFAGRDGGQLAYRDTGSGRPLILLHGFLGTGSHWLEPGPAAALGEHGFRLVLPDLRGHGESTRSHDPQLYPPDVLADDGLALIDQLGLGPGEYSSRTGSDSSAPTRGRCCSCWARSSPPPSARCGGSQPRRWW